MINEFIDKKNKIAVISVSEKSEEYGYKIFIDLINAGDNAYTCGEIVGHKRYYNLKELGFISDVVNIVIVVIKKESL